ncbi:YkgJ family cysteine cluster protein [Burkholderia pseudomallei]|uniref:YkgJ family cysteine cluster protein n=1 Tax=Burkholderia pseudomallei TaxID=28450 RepID=UPI000A1A22F0|nr:YkgJ family cysteine cluster protein [Burkholderia pseudomallei]ARL25476.1 hypothetical protein BOC47_24185 [Burkholderia pseudomallei]ARL77588.1 hypothetical protein BOC54_36945 [Burkholderia pseudomallei]ARL84193.1 hypothetical protein BOC55_35270 [Burkholderia pseudomallei]
METDIAKFAADADNPEYPEPIRARLRVVGETAQKNIEAINARRHGLVERLTRDANALLKSPKSKTEKIYAVWALADELYAHTAKNVACKRGCSHCCHIAVAVTPDEAEAIGKRIGRKPHRAPLRKNPGAGFAFGYHNPCTFLRSGECSIYANRPLACRIHYSLDVDALLCELRPPQSSPVPLMNPLDANMLLLYVVQPESENCLADIREFFPPRKL